MEIFLMGFVIGTAFGISLFNIMEKDGYDFYSDSEKVSKK